MMNIDGYVWYSKRCESLVDQVEGGGKKQETVFNIWTGPKTGILITKGV